MENFSPRLSIIIPTLHEESQLRGTVEHLFESAKNAESLEVIIVDAGSTDKTKKTIEGLPVLWFSEPSFRFKKYESLNFGLQKATAPVVQFLDADTLLPEAFDELIIAAMAKGNVGGAFEMRFSQASWKLFLLSKLNQVRYRIWKTCYGDQAIFCDKQCALKVDGFPKTLMEAAYFCKRLRHVGKFKILNQKVLTSSRRFDEGGFWIVLWFDIRMWVRFVFGLPLENQSSGYWEQNAK